MKTFSELCACVKDHCDPAISGASVYVGLEHIDSGVFLLNRHGKPSDVQSAKTRFRQGDVLYGKLRPYLDKAVIAPSDGICSTDILAFRPNPECCAAYLLGLIHTNEFRTHADQTTDGVNHPRTSWHGLSGFAWDVPAKPEQEKIAAVLWKTQHAIRVEEKLIATTRELKQSAIREIFTRGLTNEQLKETESGPMPKNWEMQPIRANAKLIAGGTPARGVKEFWAGGTIPWVKTGEVNYCVINDTEEKITPVGLENSAAKILPKGTLLIAMYGQGITRAKVAILGIDAATNQACAGIVPTNDKVLPRFLYYYLTFSYDRLRSYSHGAQQQNLNAELVGSFPAPSPMKSEQEAIIKILQTIDRKLAVHERKRAALSDLFQTFLHQLMTGQIRVDKLDIDTSEITTANPTPA